MDACYATELYKKLEEKVCLFYKEHERVVEIMRHAIALKGAFFNTRMVAQYLQDAKRLSPQNLSFVAQRARSGP